MNANPFRNRRTRIAGRAFIDGVYSEEEYERRRMKLISERDCLTVPDGRLLAVGQQDGFVTFIDSGNQEPVQRVTYSSNDYIADLTWSPDGESLASASCFSEADLPAICALVVWRPSSDEYIQSFRGGDYEFTSVAWSPSGKYIASAFLDGNVTLYNPGTGHRVRTFRTPVGSTVVAWAPDGQTLAAGSEDGSILLWTIH